MNRILVMVLAGGASRELPVLTAYRSKAALPYGGKYRVIDFCLSNCSNSGLYDVGVLAQYNPASLIAHIGNGAPWDLNRRTGGVTILQPYAARAESNWFRGTADALFQHLEVIRDAVCDQVLVLSADQVYKMDYRDLIKYHRYSGSQVTVGVRHHSEGESERYGGIEIDDESMVRTFVEKPESEKLRFVSLGIYVFDREVLIERLSSAGEGGFDIVYDILMPLVKDSKVRAYVHQGYWADIGWLGQYYDSTMALLGRTPCMDLNDPAWPILTKTEIQSPTTIARNSCVESALIGSGCLVEGTVRDSVLFPGVRVGPGATVEGSIIFSEARIEAGATVNCCIVDKKVWIGRDATIGFGNLAVPNSDFPDVVKSGISVIGKGAVIPDGIRIGRNCLIGPDVTPEIIPRRDIVCGETIAREERWLRIWS
jgi:glucose-1-phosphate adenylyltransferase